MKILFHALVLSWLIVAPSGREGFAREAAAEV